MKEVRVFVYYLKIDTRRLSPPGDVLWVPIIGDATPFETEADAKAVQSRIADATGVSQGENSYFYVYLVQGKLT